MPRLRFTHPVYWRAVGDDEDAPRRLPAIIFAGRSNAGKSSVINALCGGKFARVSGTPGSTRAIQLFELGDVMLADFPGYGYAARAREQRRDWRRAAARFLGTARLLCIVTVVDCRRGIGDLDAQWLNMAMPLNAPMLVLLNKMDKLNRREQKTAGDIEVTPATALPFSATKKSGVEEARKFIARCVAAAGKGGGGEGGADS